MQQEQPQQRRVQMNSPEMQAYRREVSEATFTKEGMMVAFPTCFPGMTVPIAPDESRITALDIAPQGAIHGGTSGYQAHLFSAEFHGIEGVVFDLGVVPNATECVAVCCGRSQFAALVNGPKGGRAIQCSDFAPGPRTSSRSGASGGPALRDLGECVAGEPVVHAVAVPSSDVVVGTTSRHVFKLDLTAGKIEVVGEAPAGGRLARASKGSIVGRDSARSLWLFDPASSKFQRAAIQLPAGAWNLPLSWARDTRTGMLYTANEAGQFFSFDEAAGFSGPLGQAPLAPVGPMAVTLDGRVFGFCGEEMARLFCLDPAQKKVVAARRRRLGDRTAPLRLRLRRRRDRPRWRDHIRRERQRRPRLAVLPAHRDGCLRLSASRSAPGRNECLHHDAHRWHELLMGKNLQPNPGTLR